MSSTPQSKDLRSVYRCWFDDPSGQRRCTDVPREKGIAIFREGIWLNDDLEYDGLLANKHWLPPSRIVLVTKLEVSDE